jgi:hypothetical protein
MDERGYWHHEQELEQQRVEAERKAAERGGRKRVEVKMDEINDEIAKAFPGRSLMSVGIGETVQVVKNGMSGDYKFIGCEKNKVMLEPIAYLGLPVDFADAVTMKASDGRECRAQVWHPSKNGMLILRTLGR